MDRRGFWLHLCAVLTAVVTLPLIFIGGLVTSHEAALAVPDWPTSYGYNMFFFPWDKMVGGIFYEHTHRLVASAVGFMTLILAVWLWLQDSRRWMKHLGLAALALVILQGVLGGLRVILLKQQIAIFHACLAQMFFCLVSALALFTSRWWRECARVCVPIEDPALRRWTLSATIVIFLQLILGATMRHTGSGLAIPDLPLMYGHVFPPLTSAAIEVANNQRIWLWGLDPVTLSQVMIHLSHRISAVAVVVAALLTARRIVQRHRDYRVLTVPALAMALLVMAQFFLGMFVVWTQKAADIATAHVALGALTLVFGFLLTLISFKLTSPHPKPAPVHLPQSEGATA